MTADQRIDELVEAGESLAWGRIANGSVEVVARRGPVEVRPWASVSKLVTALGVHVALEDGSLDPDKGLGRFRLMSSDLLAHCSGLPTGESGDERLRSPGLVEPSFAPRERRVYSNIGYELLGRSLEEASRMPLSGFLAEAVLHPASMNTAGVLPGLSTELGVTGAAFGLAGTADDLVNLVRVLSQPRVVAAASLARLRRPLAPDLAGILPGFGRQTPNPWGQGAEIRGSKEPHWMGSLVSPEAFGHFGQSGSFLWIDPVQGCFGVFLGVRPFGMWAKERWPVLNDAIIRALSS